jgi:prepilin-type N-terminal cleavage/methylation domain-containing protein
MMKKKQGFSLLEIIIALAILIIGVASVVNMFPVGLHASKRAADFSSAAILAQEKMAEAMYLGYDGLGEIDGAGGMSNPPGSSGSSKIPFPIPDEAYNWYMEIAFD